MKNSLNKKFLVFLNINGWGISLNTENNAIRKAQIPAFKKLVFNYPATVVNVPNIKDSDKYRSLGLGRAWYPEISPSRSLSQIISQANLSQLKIAYSYDFSLISIFFNNSEERFLAEDWKIVKSSKSIKNLPFSRNDTLLKELLKNIKSRRYDFIFSSLPDLSRELFKGDFSSQVLAIERLSGYLKKVSQLVLDLNGTLIISSIYGGAEESYNIGTGIANRSRSANPVPLIIIDKDLAGRSIGSEEAPNNDLSLLSPQGTYLDISPTILKILGLEISLEMEGSSFL